MGACTPVSYAVNCSNGPRATKHFKYSLIRTSNKREDDILDMKSSKDEICNESLFVIVKLLRCQT
jgi:hypothetical protein